MHLRFGCIGLSVGLLAMGCEGDSTQVDPFDDLSTEMAKMACDTIFSCCDATELSGASAAALFESTPKTTAECIDTYKQTYAQFFSNLKQFVAAGGIDYDATQAKLCIATLAGQCSLVATTELTPAAIVSREDAACKTFVVGKVAEGGSCSVHMQCTDGLSCLPDDDPSSFEDKCAPLRVENEPCAFNFMCAAGLHCSFSEKVCMKPQMDGAPCGPGTECANGYCGTNPSVCTPKKVNGEACTVFTPCEDGWCDTDTNVCTAKKAVGEACVYDNECVTRCDDGGTDKCLPPLCDGQ